MNLRRIRERIDELDREILSLLNERMALALRTGSFKEAVRDEEREAQVLDHVGRYVERHHPLLRGDFARALYREIMKESRRAQEDRQEV